MHAGILSHLAQHRAHVFTWPGKGGAFRNMRSIMCVIIWSLCGIVRANLRPSLPTFPLGLELIKRPAHSRFRRDGNRSPFLFQPPQQIEAVPSNAGRHWEYTYLVLEIYWPLAEGIQCIWSQHFWVILKMDIEGLEVSSSALCCYSLIITDLSVFLCRCPEISSPLRATNISQFRSQNDAFVSFSRYYTMLALTITFCTCATHAQIEGY